MKLFVKRLILTWIIMSIIVVIYAVLLLPMTLELLGILTHDEAWSFAGYWFPGLGLLGLVTISGLIAFSWGKK